MPRRRIEGLRTIVTGASSGIGRALVIQLVHRGARVVAAARSKDRLDELVRELAGCEPAGAPPLPRSRREGGGEVVAFAADVTRPEDRALVAKARETFGGLDLLVNNAGMGAVGPFAEAGEDRLRRLMEVNFFAVVELTRAALPELRRGNWPMIVNVASILGRRAMPLANEYCASKFAVVGWSQSVRAELYHEGIDLLVACPGATRTDFLDRSLGDPSQHPWPTRFAMSPERVARRIVWGIRHGRHEMSMTLQGRFMLFMNRLCRRCVDYAMQAYGKPRRRHESPSA